MKNFLIFWFFIFYCLMPSAFAYYQAEFYCSFNSKSLIITPSSHQWWRNCLDLIAQLRSKKQEINKQIEAAIGSSDYNTSAKKILIKQRSDMDYLVQQTISWVNNLELKLYSNYKKKYFSKLKPIRAKLIAKQAVLSADLFASIVDWEKILVSKISKTIGFNYQRIKLIEGILTSKSLDEMIPLLTTYELIVTNPSWKLYE